MPKYVIEREMPSVGYMTNEELQGASQVSVGVLRDMGPQIQWVHSYVTGDKIYCVYISWSLPRTEYTSSRIRCSTILYLTSCLC